MEKSIFKDKTFLLLFVFASVYILWNIGTGSLSAWDEATYANISRQIIKTGNWLILQEVNAPWFDKPPLYMWISAVFFKIFGVNEFSVRLTSSLFGIATVLLVYIFSKKISDKNTATLAALILLATPHFVHLSKLGMMDVPLTFFILLAVYLFWMGQQTPKYLFFCGIALSAGYLMKGFAVFLGLIIIFAYCIFSKDVKRLFKREFILGILSVFAVIFLWHFIQFRIAGPQAIEKYFGFHIFQRATTAIEGHTGGINFYQKAIFNKSKPWSALMYLSVFYVAWLAIKKSDKKAVLLICWIAASYVLYTAVQTKIHWYIIPIYPALAISSAFFLQRFFKESAFKFLLGFILLIMLIQIPFLKAFKLDFCPDLKKAAVYSQDLHKNGSAIYFYGAFDNKDIFYLWNFTSLLSKDNIPSKKLFSSKRIYCVVRADDIDKAHENFRFIFKPVRHFGDITVSQMESANN